MKKIVLAIFLVAAGALGQTGCVAGSGVTCSPNLNLWLLPPHYQDWGVPWDANATAIDTFAGSLILRSPTASQTVTQPALTYTNLNALFVFGTPALIRFGATEGTQDGSLTRLGAGRFSLDSSTAGNGLGTLSLGGLSIAGSAGTVGQCLSSDGTNYNTPVNCLTGLSGVFYQSVASNGTLQTQQTVLNFISPLTATNGSGQTVVGVNTTGSENKVVTAVTAGTTGNCAKWLATGGVGDAGFSCSSPTIPAPVCSSSGCYVIFPGGLIEQWGSANSTSPSVTITYPYAFTTEVTPVWSTVDFGTGATRNVAYLTAEGTSGFTVQTDASSVSVKWHALGH